MQINGPHHVHGPQGINAPRGAQPGSSAKPADSLAPTSDQLEISPAAQAAIEAAESGQVRQELVDRIRSEIAAGTYETPQKLDAALDRLLDEIA